MKLCIVGTGMYVCGRQTDGFGTILPAVSAFQKNSEILSQIQIVGTRASGAQEAAHKAQQLASLTGVSLPLQFYPNQKDSAQSYLEVLEKIDPPGCAIVSVPDHLHCEVTAACLKRGLHTLVV